MVRNPQDTYFYGVESNTTGVYFFRRQLPESPPTILHTAANMYRTFIGASRTYVTCANCLGSCTPCSDLWVWDGAQMTKYTGVSIVSSIIGEVNGKLVFQGNLSIPTRVTRPR